MEGNCSSRSAEVLKKNGLWSRMAAAIGVSLATGKLSQPVKMLVS